MKDFLILTSLIIIAVLLLNKKRRRKKHKLIFTTFINNSQIQILSMQLEKQQFVSSILSLVDSDTQAIILAQFSDVVLTSSDPGIFTADTDVNSDAQIDVVGVAVGEATLNVKAKATYVDANTGKEVTTDEEANVTVSISAPPPGAQNTSLVVSFTNPQPVS